MPTSRETNPMEQSLSLQADSHSVSQEIHRFYVIRKFITVSTRVLSQMHPVHTSPHYFPMIHSKIISHLRLGLPGGVFPSGLYTKILYAFLISPIPYRERHKKTGRDIK